MELVAEYQSARRDEEVARLRRAVALRGMRALGQTQRQIAQALGISQPAVSQQLSSVSDMSGVASELLMAAAAPVVKALAAERGYGRIALFGSIARGEAGPSSDVDLLVEAPPGASSFELVGFKMLLEQVLGRKVDLVTWSSLKERIDDDIRHDAVLL